jgi:hypothetical protein
MLYGTVAYILKDGEEINVGALFLFVILSSMMGSLVSES